MAARKKRRMPPAPAVWLELEAPTAEAIAEAEAAGRPEPPDFTGWRVKVRDVPAGVVRRALGAIVRSKAASDLDIADADPETLELMGTWHFDLLRDAVADWDFVDEEGEPIPYGPGAWDLIPVPLVTASLRTVTGHIFTPPKAS